MGGEFNLMLRMLWRSRLQWHIAIAAIGVMGVAYPTRAAPHFTDLQDHWAQSCIENLAETGVLSGDPNGLFRPNDPVKRVEFAVMVQKAFADRAPKHPSHRFSDIPENFWGLGAIDMASRTGFIVGYPDGTFRPNDLISRANVLVALVNGLTYPLSPRPIDEVLSAALVDWGGIPTYARAQISTAIVNQLAVNYPDAQMLRPNFAATRAEVAAFLCQSLLPSGQTQLISPTYLAAIPQLSLPNNIRRVRTLYSLLPNPQNRVDFIGIEDVALSPDGRSIAATTLSNDRSGANLMLWEVETGILKVFLPTGEMRSASVVFHPDGQHLAYSRGTSIDLRQNLPAALPQAVLTGHTHGITDLAASADGRWLVSAGEDRQVQLWDWQQEKLVRTFAARGETQKSVAIDPKGQFVVSSDGNTIEVWELQTGKLRRTIKPGNERVEAIALSPDGRTLASASANNVTLWNLNTPDAIQTLTPVNDIHSLAFSPDGRILAVGLSPNSGSDDLIPSGDSLQLWNVATGTQIASWQGHRDAVRAIVFTADGKTLMSGSEDGSIQFWEIAIELP